MVSWKAEISDCAMMSENDVISCRDKDGTSRKVSIVVRVSCGDGMRDVSLAGSRLAWSENNGGETVVRSSTIDEEAATDSTERLSV